jgi:hypothetical protein
VNSRVRKAGAATDLTVSTVAITTGILPLWLRARPATPGHLAAGILLIVIPGGLALVLAGGNRLVVADA